MKAGGRHAFKGLQRGHRGCRNEPSSADRIPLLAISRIVAQSYLDRAWPTSNPPMSASVLGPYKDSRRTGVPELDATAELKQFVGNSKSFTSNLFDPRNLFHAVAANAWAIFLIVLFFGGSIFVHELGHFLAAKAWRPCGRLPDRIPARPSGLSGGTRTTPSTGSPGSRSAATCSFPSSPTWGTVEDESQVCAQPTCRQLPVIPPTNIVFALSRGRCSTFFSLSFSRA